MYSRVKVYTDGVCLCNQNKGNIGWYGVVMIKSGEPLRILNGGYKNTTNNRMGT